MSNFLSEKQEFNQIKSAYNLSLVSNVIDVKNSRFDANAKQGQDAIDQFAKIDVISQDGSREAYVKDRVQNLVNFLNTSGNVNFERGNVAQQIKQQTSQIIDNKILTDISNTAKYRTFQKDVAKSKEGKNGEYNQVNQEFALYKSGFNDWYKDANSKGYNNLTYKNYINDAKHFTDDLDKYVKEYAVEHKYTSTGKPGDLIFRDEKHEIVDKNKIIGRMMANLTPDVRGQLEINGWGLAQSNQEQNKNDFINYNNKNISDTDLQIIDLKAKLATANAQEKIQINNDIIIKEKEIDNYKQKIKIGIPTDNDNTNMYTSNLFNKISEGYIKDDIVDSDINDSNLQIAKYEDDKFYKTEDLKLKKESNRIAKKANEIAEGIDIDEKDKIGEPKKPSEEIEEIAIQEKTKLKNVLLANDPEFAKLPAEKQWDYINARLKNDKPVDITTDESSQKTQEALRHYKEFNNQYSGNRKQAFDEIYLGLDKQYNKLKGSKDVFGGNFEESNPYLVEALKSNKDISKISREERLIILHEMATNQLQTQKMTDDQRALLEKATINLEKQKGISDGNKKRMALKSKDEVNIYNTGLGDLGWGVLKGVGNIASTAVTTGYNYLLGKDNSKNEEDFKKSSPIIDAFSKNAVNNYFNGDRNIYLGNTNIGEIQNRNIASSKQDGKDMADDFTGFSTKASNEYTSRSTALIPKIYDSRALAFGQDSKVAKQIQTVISGESNEAIELEKGSAVKASMLPGSDSIEITYIPKKEDPKDDDLPAVKKIVSAKSLPALAERLYNEIVPMGYNRRNKDAPNKRMIVTTPKETKDVFNFIRNLNTTYGEGLIPSNAINGIINDNSIMSQAQFESVAENKSPEISNKIKNISSSIYGVEWANIGGVWTGTVKKENGEELIINTKKIFTQLDGDYNEGMARLLSAKLISDAKTTQISEIIK